MRRSDLIKAFNAYLQQPEASDLVLAEYLRWCFSEQIFLWDEENILGLIPRYIAEAFEHLRESDVPEVRAYRARFLEDERLEEVPMLLAFACNAPARLLIIGAASSLMGKVTGKYWVQRDVRSYLMAQDCVVEQAFQEFIRRVYRHGLAPLIHASEESAWRWSFGQTELRCRQVMDRVVLTFARRDSEDGREEALRFQVEEDDFSAIRFGVGGVETTFTTALLMISDVVEGWGRPLLKAQEAASEGEGPAC